MDGKHINTRETAARIVYVNFQKMSFVGNSVCLLKKSVAIATLSTKMATLRSTWHKWQTKVSKRAERGLKIFTLEMKRRESLSLVCF